MNPLGTGPPAGPTGAAGAPVVGGGGAVVSAWLGAGAAFDRYLPLIQFEAQPVLSLAVRKELLRRRGVIATARCRREPAGLDGGTLGEIDDLFARLGVRPGPGPFQPVVRTAS